MKVFDGHSDIFTDVTLKRLSGERNIIKNYHIDRLKRGNVSATILGMWIDPPYTKDPAKRLLEIMGAVSEEIDDMEDIAKVAHKYEDIEKIQEQGKLAVIVGMEGLSGLKGNVNLINVLYKFGVRHAMLTWNEENEFATGVLSNNRDRGLTEHGIELIHKMEKLGMIIDVSHANEKTFWDINKETNKAFIASHSNVYNLCRVPRNLKDEQIKAIAKKGGVIGMNAWPDFVDEKKASIEKIANHIDYIANLVGVEYISFGFDFCDFLQSDTTSSFEDIGGTMTPGLEDASKIPDLIEILTKRGYKKEDLEKICYKNIDRVLKSVLI